MDFRFLGNLKFKRFLLFAGAAFWDIFIRMLKKQ